MHRKIWFYFILKICIFFHIIYLPLLHSQTESTVVEQKPILVALYSPSHEVLFNDWFYPSIKDDVELITYFVPQDCPSATYKKEGWTKTTIRKIEAVVNTIKNNMGRILIFSDVDIQFFQPVVPYLLKKLKGNDIVFQQVIEKPKAICSGFYACHCNPKTLKIFEKAYAIMKGNSRGRIISDQDALIEVMYGKDNFIKSVRWSFLPPELFYFPRDFVLANGRGWEPGDEFTVSPEIKMHHACSTWGISNKIAQLQYVYNLVQEMRKETEENISK